MGALLLACGAFAGSGLAGGPHPDPPPKPPPPPPAYAPPPPPPAVIAPPPPPPAYVAPPPPPAPVVHAKVQKPVKRPVATPKPVPKPAKPLLAAAGPVAATSTAGTLSPALLIVAFGVVLALLAVGVSFMPASAVPFALGMRLERGRQTILLSGLAIGVACALVGLLTAVAGR